MMTTESVWGPVRQDMTDVLAGHPDDVPAVVDQLTKLQDVLQRVPPLLGSPPKRYGIVYSRVMLTHLARRAEELAIILIPEIEMPGHCYAMLQALPELRDPADRGIYRNVLNPAIAQTYEVLEAILDEVARLFSSPWIHIGADEVPADMRAYLSSARQAGQNASTAGVGRLLLTHLMPGESPAAAVEAAAFCGPAEIARTGAALELGPGPTRHS